MKKRLLLCVATMLLITACNENENTQKTVTKDIKKETKMQRPEKAEEIRVKLGMPFEEFEKIKGMRKKHSPTGKWGYLNFYEKHWSTKNPATILFELDNNKTLKLPYTIRFDTFADSNMVNKGVCEIELQTGITKADLMTYEEARVKFYAFLQDLLKQGWKRALRYSQPRISDRQAMHYKLTENNMYYLDPSYEPTLEEWKKLETGGMSRSNYWVLHYKSKVFLSINLGVVPHKTDPTLASYLMFITIRDGEEEGMSYTKEREESKWKETQVDDVKRYLNYRKEAETKVKAKGYTIDESYEDYVIDPKEY